MSHTHESLMRVGGVEASPYIPYTGNGLSLYRQTLNILCDARHHLHIFVKKVHKKYREKKLATIKSALDPHLCKDVVSICADYVM